MSDGWQTVTLGEVLTKSNNWVDLEPEQPYQEVTVRLWGKGVTLRRVVSGTEAGNTRRLAVRSNQFILSRIDARNGALGLVPDFLDGAVVSNDFPVFSADPERLSVEYLGWLSKTPGFVDLCKAASEGTTNRVRLKENRFLSMKIALPPLPEQRRIVARIEELAAKIEEARGLRREAMEEAKTIVSRAIDVILSEEKWPHLSVEQIVGRANLKNGLSVRTTEAPSQFQCLTLSALRLGRISCTVAKPVPLTATEAAPYLVHHGDVYIVRGNGSRNFVGRAGLVDEEPHHVIFPDLFIRVPCDQRKLLGSFFVEIWNSHKTRMLIEGLAKTTSGIWKINQGHIASIPMPVPSIAEQKRVVEHLESLHGKVGTLKSLQEETSAELAALLPSVLDRAFQGAL